MYINNYFFHNSGPPQIPIFRPYFSSLYYSFISLSFSFLHIQRERNIVCPLPFQVLYMIYDLLLHTISLPSAKKPHLFVIWFSIMYPSAVFCSLKSSIIVSSCYHIRRFIICAAIIIINRVTYFIIVYPDHSIDIIFLRL